MIGNLIRFIDRRLWLRVLIPLFIIVMAVIIASTGYNVMSQTSSGSALLKNQNEILSKAVEGGMFDALAVGDNDVVRAQFKRLDQTVKDLRVYVYDFNGIVSFSTDIQSVGTDVRTVMNEGLSADLDQILSTGENTHNAFSVQMNGEPFLANNKSILNESRCYHCHGKSRKVLGGISVFSSKKAVEAAVAGGRTNSILIGVIGLAVIVLFIWFFFHFLVNTKIRLVLKAMAYMREGDFSHDYDIKDGDEINHILARINLVTQDLRQTIHEIQDNTGTINTSADQLNQVSDQLRQASSEASQKASTVSAAAEEMSITNRSISESMASSTLALSGVATAIEQMSATVREISKNVVSSKETTTQVVDGFESISQVVDELGNRVNDVDQITDEIRSIAEQVGMLALNAKIEAARAGEAGKGFAVVAKEITELANETNESTVKADETLGWIKNKAALVSREVTGLKQIIHESDDAISGISSAVEEQNATTNEISNQITQVSSEISKVNDQVSEGARVAADISKDITRVEDGSRQVQQSSTDLNTNAVSLLKMADGFKALVDKFKV